MRTHGSWHMPKVAACVECPRPCTRPCNMTHAPVQTVVYPLYLCGGVYPSDPTHGPKVPHSTRRPVHAHTWTCAMHPSDTTHGPKVATTLAAHMRPLLIDVIEPDAAVISRP